MADIFSATNDTRNKVPTSVFDWSHAVHTTTDLGRITPVFCELVPSKTSLRINAKLGFQFMPMVFPLQSRIRYRLAFFKYPLRALWTDFRDFTGNFRQDLEEPYIDFQGSIPQTGSLWDYLGLPTTHYGSFGSLSSGDISNVMSSPFVSSDINSDFYHESSQSLSSYIGKDIKTVIRETKNGIPCSYGSSDGYAFGQFVKVLNFTGQRFTVTLSASNATPPKLCILVDANGKIVSLSDFSGSSFTYTASFPNIDAGNYTLVVVFVLNSSGSTTCPPEVVPGYKETYTGNPGVFFAVSSGFYRYEASISSSIETVSLNFSTNPYYDGSSSNKDKQIKISAYAARAYEGIYNSWFRDNRNNPYYLNGQVEYNKWIPNYDGGADPASNYGLRYANWERDFLTTAVQTPQQGIAPLVGITTYEDKVILEDGTVRTVNKVAITDEDGKSYKIGFDSDENGLKGVSYQPLDDAQVSKPISLIQLAQSGISIADLRNVNAYQRYLELNIRAGYSYKDIIEHRFDVRIGYNELLMPEFIGGTSDWVEMHSVTQTVMKEDNGTYADALGSQAGIAGARKGTETINCFCDEECIILGVLVFTPVPIYTQLLPKHFLYRGLLDHFAPEFANIGFQPILMREVAPIQQWNADKSKMFDTFGYNRAWYEYCLKQDTAHGLYRTQLRNFIMNRVFNEVPALNQSFLLVDPTQVNDVFSVTETSDKIYGQIYFDAKVKLPIPRVAIPRLE